MSNAFGRSEVSAVLMAGLLLGGGWMTHDVEETLMDIYMEVGTILEDVRRSGRNREPRLDEGPGMMGSHIHHGDMHRVLISSIFTSIFDFDAGLPRIPQIHLINAIMGPRYHHRIVFCFVFSFYFIFFFHGHVPQRTLFDIFSPRRGT